MNIIFLTLVYPELEFDSNLYSDLFDQIVELGHNVTVIKPDETRVYGKCYTHQRNNVKIYALPTGKLTKTNLIIKGINTLLIDFRYLHLIKKNKLSFDAMMYSTPPITFTKCIKYAKTHNKTTFLLLKDIFPQNCVDLGIFHRKGFLYRYFRFKEVELYKYSKIIGCMSPANMEYLVQNNNVSNQDVCIIPNSLLPKDTIRNGNNDILDKYQIPCDVLKLIYGGNLGKPQGISFLIDCLLALKDRKDLFITIVGSGTEYKKIEKCITKNKLDNVYLIPALNKTEYINLLSIMDIGLIFLDHRFTIPNFPSRILDYMDCSLPVYACTDKVSDIKHEICSQGAGFWSESNDIKSFITTINSIVEHKDCLPKMGAISRKLLIEQYNVKSISRLIIDQLEAN